ncbi:MAG: aldolase [Rhodospirillales bacterium]|nr:aldolase [Rhodospirillales bacterium]
MDTDIRQLRVDLAASFRWAARLDLHEGICNHFSLALPGDRFLINPWGWHWSEITASSLVLCDRDGKVLEGEQEVEPTAMFIHARVHQKAPHARCVMHTHMPNALALCMVEGARLEMTEQNALRFHDRISYDDNYNGLALDNSEGDRIAHALGNRSIAFLANHGIVVVGQTVAETFDDLYYLERACKVQVLARSIGKMRAVDPKIVDKTAQQIAGEKAQCYRHFDALKRILDREEPDYKS